MSPAQTSYDVVVVGGGHNGLVAAAYLGRAGLSVLVLERLPQVGGAAVSGQPFPGHGARVSRYAHLVSLLPREVVADLDLDLTLAARPTASYAPVLRDGDPRGLLVESSPGDATAASFAEVTGGPAAYEAWRELWADVADLAHVVAPTLLQPLPVERSVRERVDPGLWRDFVTTPLGATLEERLDDDLVRGLAAAGTLGGTATSLKDASLLANRAFLYHALGNGTGEWLVPAGGMGSVTDALAAAADAAGAEVVTGAGVSRIAGGDDGAEVTWHDGTQFHTVGARYVLADVAPWVLRILLGEADDPETKPEGAQVKVDLLLDRLPRLRSGADPEVAFAGTLLVDHGLSRLETAFAEAASGEVPSVLPTEVHCPSLADRSALGPDAPEGQHALTLVGLQVPAALFAGDPVERKRLVVERVIAALNQHLEDPLESCVATDADGSPCIEARTPQDVEAELGMPGGHPYHGDLDWPWASNRALLDTPARQWGVASDVGSVLVCGAGARRGGGVSGIGGHNAARAVLASR